MWSLRWAAGDTCTGGVGTRARLASLSLISNSAFVSVTADFQSVLCLRASMKVVSYLHQTVHAVGECKYLAEELPRGGTSTGVSSRNTQIPTDAVNFQPIWKPCHALPHWLWVSG